MFKSSHSHRTPREREGEREREDLNTFHSLGVYVLAMFSHGPWVLYWALWIKHVLCATCGITAFCSAYVKSSPPCTAIHISCVPKFRLEILLSRDTGRITTHECYHCSFSFLRDITTFPWCKFWIKHTSSNLHLKELPTSSATLAVSGVKTPLWGYHLGEPITFPKCLAGTWEERQEMAMLRPIRIVPSLFTIIIMISQAQAKYPCMFH